MAALLTVGFPMPTVVNKWESPHPNSNLLIYAISLQVFDTEKETSKQMLANRNDRPGEKPTRKHKNLQFMVDL